MSETKSTAPKKEDTHSYWTNCPMCGRRVVREVLGEKGCFICGYRTEDRYQKTDKPVF